MICVCMKRLSIDHFTDYCVYTVPSDTAWIVSGPDLAGGRPGAQPNYGQWRI